MATLGFTATSATIASGSTTSGAAAPEILVGAAAGPVYCSGVTCEGRDAVEMGCVADARAITGFDVIDGTGTKPLGDLNYSAACKAVWGEYQTTNAADRHYIVLFVQPEYGGVERPVTKVVTGAGHWQTAMASWNNSVKFCATSFGIDPDIDKSTKYDGLNVCTRWR
ncbi:DUF2690 domain-containing protein [Alloactinosynnema sp. L-07]|uniref:DUF2690 domain-containing protein n=1 Tax=Alloactinosynnema sp. L-07 TaxID=1653480 RepID=UPI0006B57C3A|nr:DUF2690 domain-containing protein [Alloactinosynnema sp. L-07]